MPPECHLHPGHYVYRGHPCPLCAADTQPHPTGEAPTPEETAELSEMYWRIVGRKQQLEDELRAMTEARDRWKKAYDDMLAHHTATRSAAAVPPSEEVEKLRRRVELAERARDRHLPCPDHRDKVREGECQVCRAERAEARLAAAVPPETETCPHGMTKPWSSYWGPCRFCEPAAAVPVPGDGGLREAVEKLPRYILAEGVGPYQPATMEEDENGPWLRRPDVLALASRLSSVGASADTLDNTVRAIAAAAYQAWDRDEDSRVGKLLRALAGESGIRPDLDAARAALSQEARP